MVERLECLRAVAKPAHEAHGAFAQPQNSWPFPATIKVNTLGLSIFSACRVGNVNALEL